MPSRRSRCGRDHLRQIQTRPRWISAQVDGGGNLLSDQHIEDIIQEAFARIVDQRCDYSHEVDPGAYLCRTAWNVFQEHRAKARIARSGDLEMSSNVEVPSPLALVEATEQALVVRAVIGRLPRVQRQAVDMVYLQGMERSMVAKTLGCSVHAVHVAISRARHHLCLLMDRDTPNKENPKNEKKLGEV